MILGALGSCCGNLSAGLMLIVGGVGIAAILVVLALSIRDHLMSRSGRGAAERVADHSAGELSVKYDDSVELTPR
jgi:hypothetical protein